MAQAERNMAEAPPGTLVIPYNRSGIKQGEYSVQEEKPGEERKETKDWLKEVASKPSLFEQVSEVVELSSKISREDFLRLSPNQQQELHQRFNESRQTMEDLLQPTKKEDQEELERVLVFLRDDIGRIYTEVTAKLPVSSDSDWYPTPTSKSLEDKLNTVHKALGEYEETLWDYGEGTLGRIFGENTDIRALRRKYEGAVSYLASKVATAIEKELKEVPLLPTTDLEGIGDSYLLSIKADLENRKGKNERIRREERKRATANERLHYNNWREKFDFTWAETAEELRDSVDDWLDYFQQQLPKEAEDKVYESANQGLHNALASLEQARNRIRIPVESPIAQELRAKIEGSVAVIGGVQLLEGQDGFDGYIKFLTDFAKNFNAHHDAIYLGNAKAAIIHDFFSQNDGEMFLGGKDTLLKPLDGDTKAFREELERKAKAYAAIHELYIKQSDFEKAEKAGANGRYTWGENDAIEELLLHDTRGLAKADALAIADPRRRAEGRAKVWTRTAVFQRIKDRLDKEDGLFGKSEDERRQIIRAKIRQAMKERGYTVLLDEIDRLQDLQVQDQALWGWVKDHNTRMGIKFASGLGTKLQEEVWFPTSWDTVRLSINNPLKLIDRALSKTEFQAMVEEVEDKWQGYTEKQIRDQITKEFDAKARAEVIAEMNAAEMQNRSLPRHEARRRYLEKMKQADVEIEKVLFERQSREIEAERVYNLNKAYVKFLGVEARWGGLTTRVIDENGDVKLKTISSMARDILQAKIDKEEADIEKEVEKFAQVLENKGISGEELEQKKLQKRRILRRDATFAATLALREIGIANDLPIWNYYYYGDVSQIGAFSELLGYDHDDKGKLIEVLERGRRELEAVYAYLAQQHLEIRMLSVKNIADLELDEKGDLKSHHEEQWVRPRVINAGGDLTLRNLFESRMMISTSGGVKVPDLIAKIADLGIYDFLWENGCWDFREFHGFIKRRDEVELRKQSFLNTRKMADPVSYTKRLRGASTARIFLVGGEIQGQGYQPGVLNEVLKGAWRMRRKFLQNPFAAKHIRDEILGRTITVESWVTVKKELQEALEQHNATRNLSPVGRDELVELGGDVISFLRAYLASLAHNRLKAGYAPKNWHYENELKTQGYFEELARRAPIVAVAGEILGYDEKGNMIIAKGGEIYSDVEGEELGGQGQAFAIQGRSKATMEIYEDVLRGSTYEIFDEEDRRVIDAEATKAHKKMGEIRQKLWDTILSQSDQLTIKQEEANLDKEQRAVRQAEAALIGIMADRNKLNQQQIDQKMQALKQADAARKTQQLKVHQTRNEAVRQELERQKHNNDLTNELLRKQIEGRRKKLMDLKTSPENLEREINRLIDYYIEDRLHRQVAGEWPARFTVRKPRV